MHEITTLISPFGRYQGIVWLMTFLRSFPVAWNIFAALFVAPHVEHWCSKLPLPALDNCTEVEWKNNAIPGVNASYPAVSQLFDSCKMFPIQEGSPNSSNVIFDRTKTVQCDAWTYNEESPGSSAVPEWDLMCRHEWQRSLMTSVVFIGLFVGSPITGYLSDRFGRRPTFFGSLVGTALFGTLCALAPTVQWYNALRFFTCFMMTGFITSSTALLAEVLGPRSRTLLSFPYTAGAAIPMILLPAVAYLARSWKILQLVVGLSALICVPFMLVVEESPRWLITAGRERDAERAIARILQKNNRTLPDLHSTVLKMAEKIRESQKSVIGPLEILKHRAVRKNTILLFVLWFCDSFLTYTVCLRSVLIQGNHLINFAGSSAAEVPASIVGMALVYYCRRRPSQLITLVLGGMAAAAVQFSPPGLPYYGLSITMVGRFLFVLTASVKWVWTIELFPTEARGFGFAACYTVSRVGAMLAPFVDVLKSHVSVYAVACLLGGAGVLGAVMAGFLPETFGAELPDTFREAEDIGKEGLEAERDGMISMSMTTFEEKGKPINT